MVKYLRHTIYYAPGQRHFVSPHFSVRFVWFTLRIICIEHLYCNAIPVKKYIFELKYTFFVLIINLTLITCLNILLGTIYNLQSRSVIC